MTTPQTTPTQANIQDLILSSMCTSEDAAHLLLPHIKTEYFEDDVHRAVFDLTHDYITKFNKCPPKEALSITLQNAQLTEETYQSAVHVVDAIYKDELTSVFHKAKDWLMQTAETYCRDRAIYLAIMQSIAISDGQKVDGKKLDKGAIPQLLQNALAVSFDPSIGHDYAGDAAARYDYYHVKQLHIPTGIDIVDEVLGGGVTPKTLNFIMAPPKVGKSTMLCSFAANMYMAGRNVLYITCEMAEERIAERIDANLMDIPLSNLKGLPLDSFNRKIAAIKAKCAGKLIIKEYPNSTANVNHFRALLDDLKLRCGFVPEVIIVDYLGIMAPARISKDGNLYEKVKAISEELRALAVERNVPIWSAIQTNRGGMNNNDYELTEVSESFGIVMTADLILAMISTDQLEQMQQVRIKQLANRYSTAREPSSFLIGLDRARMRLYNLSRSAAIPPPVAGPSARPGALPVSPVVSHKPAPGASFDWKV